MYNSIEGKVDFYPLTLKRKSTAVNVRITDTTFRDAHQSLMATRMRTEDMLPIAERMDSVGFWSLEAWGGATFDACIRYLGEDPWERVRLLKKRVRQTPLQMLLRGQNLVGYRHYPDDIVIKFIEKSVEVGIEVFRIFDALNDIRNMKIAIDCVKKNKMHAQGAICYTTSPVHTVETYVRLAKEFAELECDSICIKDMSGIITPKAAYDLVKAMRTATNLPVHLHSHCTSGMAPMAYMLACEAGVGMIDTAFSAFAWGSSQPPVESVVAALRGTPYDPGLDLELLVEVGEYFRRLREKYEKDIDPIALRVDTEVLVHQLPGGMLSNLIFQLKEQDAMDKFDAVLREVPQVRKDLGYPPLVTPSSQFVGTQAVMNVLAGERYKLVSREVKDYVRGLYGKQPAPVDEKVKRKIIGDEPTNDARPADLLKPELPKFKEEAKEFARSEEDILTYALFPHVAPQFFKQRGAMSSHKESLLIDDVAAISAAVAYTLSEEEGVRKELHPRPKNVSPWVAAGRLEQTRNM